MHTKHHPDTAVVGDKQSHAPPESSPNIHHNHRHADEEPWSLTVFCRSLSRTSLLRAGFIFSLLLAAFVCFFVAYVAISNLEHDVGEETYESVAVSALAGAHAITTRKILSGRIMSSFLSFAFPNATMWPNVALPGYLETVGLLVNQSSSKSSATIPIVKPEEVESFEAFAKAYYERDHPEGAGYSPFGFGIHAKYPNGTRYHFTTGNTTWGSPRNLLAPIFQHNIAKAGSMMFDVHSEVFRGTAIDSMLDCAEEKAASTACGVVTDFVELIVRPGPACLLYQPIYPANDPNTVVGFMGTSINFEEVLTAIVPNYVDGLYCVISTDTKSVTYVIRKGFPLLLGDGDLHDKRYTIHGRSVVLNDFETGASASKIYTLTTYPSDAMFEEFKSNSPLEISFGFVGVIILCGIIFIMYDVFTRRESKQRRRLLEMKRRFVRFVSHEIRTPLNTVWLGLKLLDAELNGELEKVQKEKSEPENDTAVYSADEPDKNHAVEIIKAWLELTTDISENADTAIATLNDLLNYDKIETGNLHLEVGEVNIWRLIKKTTRQFKIHANNKRIELNINVSPEFVRTGDLEDVEAAGSTNNVAGTDCIVLGDVMRLGQVIRNLISNALKFTPENGTVTVNAIAMREGLDDPMPDLDYPAEKFSRKGMVRITVSDTGAGLTEEQVGQLFNEGVQFDANKLQAGGGSGLGLFITKGVVLQHGGTIRAESKGLGHGVTFTVDLPLLGSSKTRKSRNPADNSEGTSETLSDQNHFHRVLVVDDALLNRKMLVRLLERRGHVCESASNGREAVDAYIADKKRLDEDPSHTPFDTILMDFEMPVMKGPDATKELRDLGCSATIFGVTGNVFRADVEHFKAQGANAVLSKPVDIATIEDYWRPH